MCLTIPKKVVALTEDLIVLENINLSQETARSVIKVEIGDYVIVENAVIIEKINQDRINEFFQITEI